MLAVHLPNLKESLMSTAPIWIFILIVMICLVLHDIKEAKRRKEEEGK